MAYCPKASGQVGHKYDFIMVLIRFSKLILTGLSRCRKPAYWQVQYSQQSLQKRFSMLSNTICETY